MEASDTTPAIGPSWTGTAPAATPATPAATVTLKVNTHLIGFFDPSEEGIPVITAEGTEVPAGEADRLIEKALEHGVTVEKVEH